MKIAASIILVAGLGWIIIKSTTSTTQQNEVAVNKSNNEYKLQPLPSVTEDSTAVVFNTPNVNDKVILKNEVVSAETPSQPVRSQTNTAPIVSQPSAIAPQTDQLQEVVVQNQLKTFSPKYDSTKNVVIAREEKAASNVQPSTDTLRHVDVVLQSTKVAPDEEFVVTKKSKDLASTSRRMQIKVDTLEPAEGWTRYDDYIADNLKTPDEFKLKPTTGFVELSFDVNKNGEPVNITVTKSLCDKCDEEAIRLLKEGPKWKAGSKKGKIKIKF